MIALFLGSVLLASATRTGTIWVSPTGSDSNPGTQSRPLASLPSAVTAARTRNAAEILLEPGEYRIDASVKLGPEDSGLTIRAEAGKRAVLVGSVTIPADAVHPCHDQTVLTRVIDASARTKIKVVDLTLLGVTGLAAVQPRGFSFHPDASTNELFSGRTPLTLARWPNQDYAKITKVIEPGNGEDDANQPMRKPVIVIGDRAKLWTNASDIWLYGYWKFDWADDSIPVDSIDPATGAITLAHPHAFGVAKDAPFYAENLLEELDVPGEYYLDRKTNRLYFLPPVGDPKVLRLSVTGAPFIDASKASNLSIVGVDFAFSRADGVHFSDCESSRMAGCRFFDLGGKAVVINGGHHSGVQSCDIWNTGEGGVVLNAGNRSTLESAGDYVDNCDIHDYQRRGQTYRPAVSVDGCGNRVTRCSLHDAPHSAIIYQGNNHLFSANDVYRTISRTGDGGVFYTGRDWTARGTIISNNYFHDNVGQRKWEPAIYLDDQACGIKITGNTIERCHWGFLIGGGRDNVVTDNEIIDCDQAFTCDARGLGWAAKAKSTLVDRLNAVPYHSAAWKSAYPTLADILNEDPMAPADNVISHNLLVNSGKVADSMEAPFKKTCDVTGNVVVTSKPAPRSVPGFTPVDRASVGVFVDRYRGTLHD